MSWQTFQKANIYWIQKRLTKKHLYFATHKSSGIYIYGHVCTSFIYCKRLHLSKSTQLQIQEQQNLCFVDKLSLTTTILTALPPDYLSPLCPWSSCFIFSLLCFFQLFIHSSLFHEKGLEFVCLFLHIIDEEAI